MFQLSKNVLTDFLDQIFPELFKIKTPGITSTSLVRGGVRTQFLKIDPSAD